MDLDSSFSLTETENANEVFEFLPLLENVLKSVVSTDATGNEVRVGDISSSATLLKEKYESAFQYLNGLSNIDSSLADQKKEIARLQQLLKKKSELVELYSNTLFSGSEKQREEEINDVFSWKDL